MQKTLEWPWRCSLGMAIACASSTACAGFVDESSATLTTRNYYLDRDYKGDSPYSAAREWARDSSSKPTRDLPAGPSASALISRGCRDSNLTRRPIGPALNSCLLTRRPERPKTNILNWAWRSRRKSQRPGYPLERSSLPCRSSPRALLVWFRNPFAARTRFPMTSMALRYTQVEWIE